MKLLSIGFSAILLTFLSATAVMAAPDNSQKADNNPQVVAYYVSGTHGIVGESAAHTGTDLVMIAGNSGNLQQWFTGNSTETTNDSEGDHSMWQNVGSATSCPSGWDLVANAYPSWGSYLQPGANYCVHTNDFASH